MKRVFSVVDRVSILCCFIGIALIAFLMFMYTFDVVGRFTVSHQIKGSYELGQFTMGILTFAAYSYAQTSRGHIQVSFLVRIFPKTGQYLTYCLGYVACFIISIIETYALWLQFQHTMTNPKVTPVLLLPYNPIYCIGSILMLVFAVTLLMDVFRCIMAIRGDKEAQESIGVLLAS